MSEYMEQVKFMNYVRKKAREIPGLAAAHHIPNGGRRSKSEAHKFKLMGVVAGIPDINIPVANKDYHGLFIEMKDGKGRASKEQLNMKNIIENNGYCVKVCNGHEEAIKELEEYLSKT
jgi:hypothetical protein